MFNGPHSAAARYRDGSLVTITDTRDSVDVTSFGATNKAVTKGLGDRVTGGSINAEGVLTLEVTDNGRGLDKGALDKPKAFGLRGLHERAKTVQGWLRDGSHPLTGTKFKNMWRVKESDLRAFLNRGTE